MSTAPKYPGIRITANGNYLVSYCTEARIADAGVFYPITPSTEMGELFQQSFAEGKLNAFGRSKVAVETEGEHAAQGGAIAYSLTGKRTVNFTSGQGLVYGLEQYYPAPGKFSTMVLEVGARALTKHALNVHCGHDDVMAALDTGWIMLMSRDAQQAADQALILRRVTELSLNPGMNIQDGFLTTHLERTFLKPEAGLIREFLGDIDDEIACPTEAQRELFGPTRRRVPKMIDLTRPVGLGPVQNQEHYMNGVIARRNNFTPAILGFLEEAYAEFGRLTGREYGLLREYNCEGAETVFVSLGSAAENIEAAVDYIQETRGETVGSIHLNVIRPFPRAALVKALAGKKRVIVLERTDEPMAVDNPMTKEIRAALSQAAEHHREGTTGDVRAVAPADIPRILSASYGLGSRDFRPEGVLGAYEYATGKRARQDGKTLADGENFFVIGIDHPYAVKSEETPSLLPDKAIAVRFHSIGGWGMITTGKNLGAIIGDLGEDIAKSQGKVDADGNVEEVLHVSANPKYGSEKKGAPTNYFLVVAPERVRVNCDLRHVSVVLCSDPKAFTHTNPLDGIIDGGAFVLESSESPDMVWKRIPTKLRQTIIDKKLRLFSLPGFDIARKATNRPELQLRMQGNAFLGAFFKVSPFLEHNNISQERFYEVVMAQYNKKFGRFGQAVVDSNMTVMKEGFERLQPIPHGKVDDEDLSGMRGRTVLPIIDEPVQNQEARPNVFSRPYFDKEFRAGYGYNQPSTALASTSILASATGATASKYVARRDTPVWVAENCTVCMDCITVCPDTALPNTAQDVKTVLQTAIHHYVKAPEAQAALTAALPGLEEKARARMADVVKKREKTPFQDLIRDELNALGGVDQAAKDELMQILDTIPLGYNSARPVFGNIERKNPGEGGLFSIFVSDLCKGCAECVEACNDEALVMKPDSEALNAEVLAGTKFLDLLPKTQAKYLGLYDPEKPAESKINALKNHLMMVENYRALVSGDGACAGCGEKSVLRGTQTVTEAFMRPLFMARADRLDAKAAQLVAEGPEALKKLAAEQPEAYATLKRLVVHLILGQGGEDAKDTALRLKGQDELTDAKLIETLKLVLNQDAFNHRDLQAIEDQNAKGMCVTAMTASTGCNSVYGSTPPNSPHPYPWMNSLFQDGATIGWLVGESFMKDHARRSVIPERLVDKILAVEGLDETEFFDYTHFTDALMTDEEVMEMPKVWAVGGDGALGDIGFQNVSKVVLQNRPNIKILLLDTQVYSNTGGQNSDSSPLAGGFDMNQFGAATQGKLTEKKGVAEILMSGHGSPFVAQVSMGNPQNFFKAVLDGVAYRGTAFFQCYTTCQPEHGVGDEMSATQAGLARDSRGMPEMVFDPSKGETYAEALDLSGNKNTDRDWMEKRAFDRSQYAYTIAHWATTEARFRRHLKKVDSTEGLVHLEDLLLCVTQDDVVHHRYRQVGHRAYVPDFGAYILVERGKSFVPMTLSRQMVLYCIERRKAWRMLQSKAGLQNKDYEAQRRLMKRADAEKIPVAELRQNARELAKAQA